MTIPQPRRAKSSVALRDQSVSQRTLRPPALPSSISSIPSTPSVSSALSTRSASSTSSGLQTPPQQYSRPTTLPLPGKKPFTQTPNTVAISERLKLVTSELESYVEEGEEDNVHVAVRIKPTFGKERDVWTADPLRGYIGGKQGEFFFGKHIQAELT